ncbi:hypothetical protein ACMYZ5_11305 [Bacteroides sp. KG68]|uniref:hypothetical protein n=1 Tax=unclassified Bacteroides TaxID=2646097 RepID=UPI003D961B58
MCRLLTPQLEEALQGYPLYSQDGKGKDAVCCAIFALGSVRWFILEGEVDGKDTILFGIVVGLAEDEYGYVSLNELSEVCLDLTSQGLGKLQVRQQQNFQPTSLRNLNDQRLQGFLAQFED